MGANRLPVKVPPPWIPSNRPVPVIKRALPDGGLPIRVGCYGELRLGPGGGPILIGVQPIQLSLATPFGVVRHAFVQGGRNTAIIAGQHPCRLPHAEDMAKYITDLNDVHLDVVPGIPAFHCIGMCPGLCDRTKKPGCDYQNNKENPKINGSFRNHNCCLLSVSPSPHPSHQGRGSVRGYVVRLTRACEDDNSENLQRRRCGTGLQVGLPLPSSLSGDAFQVRSRSAGEQAGRGPTSSRWKRIPCRDFSGNFSGHFIHLGVHFNQAFI